MPEVAEKRKVFLLHERDREVRGFCQSRFPAKEQVVGEVHGEEVLEDEGGKGERPLAKGSCPSFGELFGSFRFFPEGNIGVHPNADLFVPFSRAFLFVGSCNIPKVSPANAEIGWTAREGDGWREVGGGVPDEAGEELEIGDFRFAFAEDAPMAGECHGSEGGIRDAGIVAIEIVFAEVGDVADGNPLFLQVRQTADAGASAKVVGHDGDFGEAENGVVEEVGAVGRED